MTDAPELSESGAGPALAAAALLAQTGRPEGSPPTHDELAAWTRGALSGARLAQVESHIAHDPAVFESAMSLSAHDTASGPQARFSSGAFALAASLMVALTLGATLLRTPVSVDQRAPDAVVRSAVGTPQDWRAAAFAAGVAGADVRVLTAAPATCLDADCAALAPVLYRYGARLAGLRDTCPAEAGALDELGRALRASFELAPYANALDRVRGAGSPSPGEPLRCADIEALIQNPTS